MLFLIIKETALRNSTTGLTGLSKVRQLQLVRNVDHIITALKTLHWLHVAQKCPFCLLIVLCTDHVKHFELSC